MIGRGKCLQLPIDSGVLSTELRIVHQLELGTEDFECGPTRGIRAPLTRFKKLRNVHESTFGTFYSASYVHDGVLSPNTEGGHDYAMRSNRRMHQPSHPSEDHGANESHLSWSFGLSHKTLKTSRIPSRSIFPKLSGLVTSSYHHQSSLVWRWDIVVIFTKLSRSLIPTSKEIKQCVNGTVAKLSGCVPITSRYSKSIRLVLMELRGR